MMLGYERSSILKVKCRTDYQIGGHLIGRAGDILTITDAIPTEDETLDDVAGYCDIIAANGQKWWASWSDVEGNPLLETI